MFHNHHSHSYYSLLDGYSSPEELMKRASEIGMSALSITDHGTLSGHRDLIKAAKESNVKPILGLEAYFTTDRSDKRSKKDRAPDDQIYNHLIILSKNDRGLENLNKISEDAWGEGFFVKPRTDFDMLEKNKDGLIVLSGCMNGIISKALENNNESLAKQYVGWFRDVFGEDFYIEIQPHNPAHLNLSLLSLADSQGVKPVVTLDCHYASPEDRVAEEIMLILGTHPKVSKEIEFGKSRKIKGLMERLDYLYGDRQMSFKDLDIWLMNYEDVKQRMLAQGIDREDIYENSVEISDKISQYDIKENVDLLPVSHSDPDEQLRQLAMDGLRSRDLIELEYLERIKEELEIIKDKKFSSYFLIVSNMISWAKSQGILVGPGRGSAAGSLICYALGITDIDPIKYGLLFFRFINPERNDFPDIDTDYEDRRRGEVKEYLIEQYKHVASIATFNTFRDKGVVRDVARAFNIPLAEVNKALKGIETWEEFIKTPGAKEFREKYPEVVEYADRLRGRIRGTGLHAAGIVTSKTDISKYAPMETRKDSQNDYRIPVVAVDMDQAAEIGLIKIDALGLKTLTVIQDTIKNVKERHGVDIDLSKIDINDPEIYADLSAGFTKGVFQAEAVPYTNLLIKMGVSNLDELAASNALVRPGAMNTIGADYIKRKKGRQSVSYLHPIMKEFTEDTYGCILYQEQVMQACVALGGMTMAEADKVRKIIGKKKDAKEFDQFKDKFISGASRHVSKEAAENLWHQFEAHAGYSFNKSHAVAYSTLSYWTAWLKKYYPVEFMFSLLKNEGDKDKRTDYLIEAKRMSIKIRLPHINESGEDFTLEGDAIRFGLGNVKFISEGIAKKIIAARPFNSYEEFISFTSKKGSGVNSRAVEALNKIGGAAFTDNPRSGNEKEYLYEYLNIPEFVTNIPRWVESYFKPLEGYDESGAFIVMGMVKSIKRGEGWSRVEIVDKTASVGVFHNQDTTIEAGKIYIFLISDNRISSFIQPESLNELNTSFVQFLKAKTMTLGPEEYFVVDVEARRTKKGDKMAHAVLSNEDKELTSVIIFPSVYAESLSKMKPGTNCKPILSETSSGAVSLKGFIR
jgi:DNA polymerase III subunit alpha